jgi:hypothetical protein
MSHFEKTYSKASLVILALTISGCSGGFSPSQFTGMSSGSSLASNDSGSTGSLTGLINSSSIATAISTALQIANSLSQNFTLGACSGSTGPSSQTMTDSYPGTSVNVTASTLLTYSAGNCDPLSSNQITLAPTVNATSTDGDTFSMTSAPSANYLGTSVGGGVQVNYNISAMNGTASILGLHSVTTGSVPTDISISSTSPFGAGISFTAPYFSLTSEGGFEIDDNTDQISLNVAASGLAWSQTCGCPVAGSLSGTISGPLSGPVSITYGATCGSVTLSAYGISTTVSVPQCQL